MAKIKKRADGLYQLSVIVTEKGKQVRKYFYGHTQQEAKRKMMAYQERIEAGKLFRDLAEEWQDHHWPEIKAGTQTCYNPALKRAINAFGDQPAAEVTPLEIRREMELMAAQGYGKKSVSTYLSVVNQIFRYGITEGDLTINPTVSLSVPKGLAKGTREVPDDPKLVIIRSNIDQPFGLFAYMLLYTGLRRGELLALQWRDIDFDAREISVRKAVSYAATGNQPDVGTPKTQAGVRNVILMERLVPHLEKRKGRPNEYIFGGAKPMTQSTFRSAWRRYCLAVGLYELKERYFMRNGKKTRRMIKYPSVTPHQLRHSFATLLFEAGIDAKDAQQQLGHSRIDVTMDIYTHIRKNHLKSVSKKLNSVE